MNSYYVNQDFQVAPISLSNSTSISLFSSMQILDVLYINEVDINKGFVYKEDFHGDTDVWITGYFSSSHAIYQPNQWFELFAGRMPRNFGLLNDYGTVLSNNPYSFDHFGFSTTGDFFKYSFYTTCLNDIVGIDLSGETIDIGEEKKALVFGDQTT